MDFALEQANITVLDLTKLKAGDPLNHGRFAESPEVVQLIGKRLAAGQTVTDSRVAAVVRGSPAETAAVGPMTGGRSAACAAEPIHRGGSAAMHIAAAHDRT